MTLPCQCHLLLKVIFLQMDSTTRYDVGSAVNTFHCDTAMLLWQARLPLVRCFAQKRRNSACSFCFSRALIRSRPATSPATEGPWIILHCFYTSGAVLRLCMRKNAFPGMAPRVLPAEVRLMELSQLWGRIYQYCRPPRMLDANRCCPSSLGTWRTC